MSEMSIQTTQTQKNVQQNNCGLNSFQPHVEVLEVLTKAKQIREWVLASQVALEQPPLAKIHLKIRCKHQVDLESLVILERHHLESKITNHQDQANKVASDHQVSEKHHRLKIHH